MIPGIYLFITLGLYLKLYYHVIVDNEGLYEGCLEPMVEVINYDYLPLTDKIVEPEEYFFNVYVDKFFKSENMTNPTQIMCIILDDK